jgi:hypothetical protein
MKAKIKLTGITGIKEINIKVKSEIRKGSLQRFTRSTYHEPFHHGEIDTLHGALYTRKVYVNPLK